MGNANTEKFLARLVAYGAAFITIFLVSGSVTDPVNAPKFAALGVVAGAAIMIVIGTNLKIALSEHFALLFILGCFIVSCGLSVLNSPQPLTQLIYGSYGRNNGVFTYLFLTVILLSSVTWRTLSNHIYIVKAILLAGLVNLSYCLWVIVFGDFISWNNPYGNILGTLGNPNFIGAFLGFIFTALVAVCLDDNLLKLYRIISLTLIPICAFEIFKSNAVQGRIVAAFGTSLVLFLYIRARFSKLFVILYSTVCLIVGLLALAGALQIGPLTKVIYKTSVSLRGQYWLAAWNTGQNHPISGVGMDGFGDWYRRMRDPHALVLPGVNTVVNAAHNVPLDLFAFGGWPLFLSYLSLVLYTGLAIYRIMKKMRQFDLVFSVLVSTWAGYQLQSIISINQIGLAVWGWLLSGAIISFEKCWITKNQKSILADKNTNKTKSTKIQTSTVAKLPLLAFLGALLGLMLALPPLTADSQWRKAQVLRSLQQIELSMKSSYFNPPNSFKYLTNIQMLEQSQLYELSRRYVLVAVQWNPDVFEFWKALYLIHNSTVEDKEIALDNMRRLDPLNPNPTEVL